MCNPPQSTSNLNELNQAAIKKTDIRIQNVISNYGIPQQCFQKLDSKTGGTDGLPSNVPITVSNSYNNRVESYNDRMAGDGSSNKITTRTFENKNVCVWNNEGTPQFAISGNVSKGTDRYAPDFSTNYRALWTTENVDRCGTSLTIPDTNSVYNPQK